MKNQSLPSLPVMRVLMLAPSRTAITRLLHAVFAGLAEQEAIHFTPLYHDETLPEERTAAIQETDIVFLFRAYTPASLALLQLAKQAGKLVIVSPDEDFTACLPEAQPGHAQQHPENCAACTTLVRQADLVWVFSQELQHRYTPLNSNVVVGRLPSSLDLAPGAGLSWHEPQKECVIGCDGSRLESVDWQVLRQPLHKILDQFPHVRVELIAAGDLPQAVVNHPRVRQLSGCADLVERVEHQTIHWSIGLAPLADTPFNRGKTNIQYQTYASLGIPGIYSALPVYTRCVQHRTTGYLTPHSQAGFTEALQTMVANPALRATIRLAAFQDATSTYAFQGVQLQFLQELSLLALRTQYRGWKKPAILIVGFDQAVSTHIDALQPCRQLATHGLLNFSWQQPLAVQPQHLDDVDAVYVVRAFQPETLPLLDWAKEKGIPVVSSWDDDFFSLQPGTPLGDYYNHPSVVAAMQRFLADSSLVMATTPPLIERSRRLGGRVMGTRYGLDTTDLRQPTEATQQRSLADSRVRIGFYGCNSAIGEEWIVNALRRLRQRYGTQIVIEIIGLIPPHCQAEVYTLIDWSENILPYEHSLQTLASRDWDIGLAPLADTPFNAAKQATKFRDYTWAGIAMVCSHTPTYARELQPGLHCLFTENTAQAWAAAVASLIEDPDRRTGLKQAARQLLDAVHMQELTNASWQQLVWRIGASPAQNVSTDASKDTLADALPDASILANQEPIPAPPERREGVGSPPLKYRPFSGILRYTLSPSHPGWKGLQLWVCSRDIEISASLAFRVCLSSGQEIRAGTAAFTAHQEASWVRLTFPEIYHSVGHPFVLEVWLYQPQPHAVGLFEVAHKQSRFTPLARRLRVTMASSQLFSQLLYTQ